MRACWIRRTGCVHDGQVMLVPQRQERRQGRVQSEKAVKLEYLVPRNVDAGTHRVIRPLAVRYDDIQSVRCASLEDHDHALRLVTTVDGTVSSPSQEAWNRSSANGRQGAVTKKYASCDGHADSRNQFSDCQYLFSDCQYLRYR